MKASDPNCWYSDMIGETLHAFQIEGSAVAWFGWGMFFLPQDVAFEKENLNALVPSFVMGIA